MCFLKLTADQVLLFRLDRGPMSGKLVENRAGLFGRPVNAHPGLTFLLCKCFCFFFVYMVIIETQNRRPNNIPKTSAQSYKTQIKILLFPGLALTGLRTILHRFQQPIEKPALGQRSTSKKHFWPQWAVNLSPQYGQVLLVSGYLVLTGINWP